MAQDPQETPVLLLGGWNQLECGRIPQAAIDGQVTPNRAFTRHALA